MERYYIEVLETDGEETIIECANLRDVISTLTSLATWTHIENCDAYDRFKVNLWGGIASITDRETTLKVD